MEEVIKINKREGCVRLSINPEIYPLDVIYSAAYVFLDRVYILLSGDMKNIQVELRMKERADKREDLLKKLAREFCNELLNYSFYKQQVEKNAALREVILKRALLTSEIDNEKIPKAKENVEIPEFDKTEADYIDDPEGIAIPWEERYGKKGIKK